MLVLQYVWLTRLAGTTAIAHRTGLRHFVEAVGAEVESFYRSQGEGCLVLPASILEGDARAKVAAALAAVEMEARADHRPDEMSGGEQQRVSIARALVHEPGYLLADEPTGELDTGTGAAILGMLRQIADRGTTIVMATHDPAALQHVDEAYFVESGRLHTPDRDELNLWLTEGREFETSTP